MFEAQDKGEAPTLAKKQGTSRRVGVGSQILADLGVHDMRLLSSTNKKYHALVLEHQRQARVAHSLKTAKTDETSPEEKN